MIDFVVDLFEKHVDLGGSHFSESILQRWSVTCSHAPLPRPFRKLLDERVKTIALFPGVETIACCRSVPLGTSDLHYSRWQSGEICQVLSTGEFMVSRKI